MISKIPRGLTRENRYTGKRFTSSIKAHAGLRFVYGAGTLWFACWHSVVPSEPESNPVVGIDESGRWVSSRVSIAGFAPFDASGSGFTIQNRIAKAARVADDFPGSKRKAFRLKRNSKSLTRNTPSNKRKAPSFARNSKSLARNAPSNNRNAPNLERHSRSLLAATCRLSPGRCGNVNRWSGVRWKGELVNRPWFDKLTTNGLRAHHELFTSSP
ncbi:hypothetical protein ACQE3E_20410 [Methylomonas sp. MED-D]|uniref:hypothetical protein n=1 Tax=Methylomonas sp. MED-D TaxID=3418768 RepID=UPI003D08922A